MKERLIKLIKSIFDFEVDENDISKVHDLVEDLGLDSLQLVELVVCIEDEFNINIEDDDLDIEKISSIDNLCKLIEKQLQCKKELM